MYPFTGNKVTKTYFFHWKPPKLAYCVLGRARQKIWYSNTIQLVGLNSNIWIWYSDFLNTRRAKKIVWKYHYATISIWSPSNSGVKIFVSFEGFRICNNICTLFWEFGSYRPVCLKKAQNFEVFYSSQFWNLNFEISKVNFLKNCWSFWDMLWKDVHFLSFEKKFIIKF